MIQAIIVGEGTRNVMMIPGNELPGAAGCCSSMLSFFLLFGVPLIIIPGDSLNGPFVGL